MTDAHAKAVEAAPEIFCDARQGTWARTEAAIAAYERAMWQPIEAAPRDGTRVMLWITGRCGIADVNIVTVGSWWSDDADCWVEDGYDTVIPTHWRPLPAGPEVGDGVA